VCGAVKRAEKKSCSLAVAECVSLGVVCERGILKKLCTWSLF